MDLEESQAQDMQFYVAVKERGSRHLLMDIVEQEVLDMQLKQDWQSLLLMDMEEQEAQDMQLKQEQQALVDGYGARVGGTGYVVEVRQ